MQICSRLMWFQFVALSVSHSWVYNSLFILCHRPQENSFSHKLHKIQNIYFMFTSDLFSVCHSLTQSVTGISLFIFWLILQEYSFSQKIVSNTEYLSCLLKYIFFYSFCVFCMKICLSDFQYTFLFVWIVDIFGP